MDERFFYANASEVGASPYDVTVRFKREGLPNSATSPSSDGIVPVELKEVLTVSMGAAHAKVFAASLVRAVREYEKRFGAIPVPTDKAEMCDAIFKRST